MYDQIPELILLNCWKHHLGFIVRQIKRYKHKTQLPALKADLLKIGNSTTDLYTGNLSPGEISEIAILEMKKRGLVEIEAYRQWMRETPDGYRSIAFPDTSVWIFRIGNEPGRYIHIHPGRAVPLSIRVKAVILKTTISAIIYSRIFRGSPFRLECLNLARDQVLGLSPVMDLKPNSELNKIIGVICDGLLRF